ncbi:MAG: DUF389 domain-containing protein [Solirubrobacteraceae bacterium]|nr:DUF389 domain-containing protein [Solirubrobacteraceae bacterium]
MVRAQIICSGELADRVLEQLGSDPCVTNLARFPGAAVRPAGDVIVADVAREEASAVVLGLQRLGVTADGSISLSQTSAEISSGGRSAAVAASGAEDDAVIWEEVHERTTESADLSGVFLGLLDVAVMIGAVALLTQSEILMVGAMVVGPEFGPLAGIVVGAVLGDALLVRRAARSLAAGIPLAVASTAALVALLRWAGVPAGGYHPDGNALSALVSMPDWSVVLVAILAGTAGILALTTAHAGALVGVLISVATVPSMAGMGAAIAYADSGAFVEATVQLAANLTGIVVAGSVTLGVQRMLFARRYRRRHRSEA